MLRASSPTIVTESLGPSVRTKYIKPCKRDMWTDGGLISQQPMQNAINEWGFHFQDEFLSSVYYTSTTKDLTGSEAKRQIDLFVRPNNKKMSKEAHDWEDVEVIGGLS